MFFIEEDQRIRGTAVSVSNSVFEGPMHPVGRDQLFFSTTDATGIITQVNSVFIELVRYPRERLIGAPHNINRHPGMPGAAFLAMWATLRQGLPFCAYVHNAASDGSRYTVFATITPLGDGYLSVRGPVCVPAYLDAATALYEAVRPVELQARDGGASAHQAAEIGLAKLVPLLNEAGFATYNDFVLATLPAEVLARDAAGATFPERPGATGELARLLTASAGVHAELQSWLARLDQLQRLRTPWRRLASGWRRPSRPGAPLPTSSGRPPMDPSTRSCCRSTSGERCRPRSAGCSPTSCRP